MICHKFFILSIAVCTIGAMDHHKYNVNLQGGVGQVFMGSNVVNNGTRPNVFGYASTSGSGSAYGVVETVYTNAGGPSNVFINNFARPQQIVEETVVKEFELGAEPSLSIDNPAGNIFITGTDKEKIVINAVKKTYAPYLLTNIMLSFGQKDNQLTIGSAMDCTRASVDYTIAVPYTTKIERAETKKGCIAVTAVLGLITLLRANDGDIQAKKVANLKKAYNEWGAIYAELNAVNGDVNLRTVNGNITLGLAETINARISAETKKGSISNYITGLQVSTRQTNKGARLEGILNSDNAAIDIETLEGNITLNR